MNHLFKTTIFIIVLLFSGFNAGIYAEDREDKLAEAQKKLEEATREYAELASELGGETANHFVRSFAFSSDSANSNKARLGINIGELKRFTDKNNKNDLNDRDIDGVKVLGVSPNSPAEKVGLKSGDIITSLNGTVLIDTDDKSALKQLTDLMADVEPGDVVDVMYIRDGVTQSARVTSDAMPKPSFKMLFGDKDLTLDGNVDIDIQGLESLEALSDLKGLEKLEELKVFEHLGDAFGDSRFIFISNNPFGDAELVELTPELGDYFGAKSGLLVIKAPADTDIDLRDGDVIRSIDGREPTSVNHAMRIMRSYEAGEVVNLELLRKKRKRNLSITMPESKSNRFNFHEWNREKGIGENKPMKLRKKIKIFQDQETT